MTTLLSIDPGLRQCGVALFKDGVLTHALLVKNPVRSERGLTAWRGMARAVERAVYARVRRVDDIAVEFMQVYPGRKGGKPADLMEVTAVASAIGAAVPALGAGYAYVPKKWKGTVPKPIHNRFIESRLKGGEHLTIEPCAPSLRNNIIDAIGIGLYTLGRL